MNYVTSIFSSFKGYYDGINGATLTGALDVIVVKQPDGTYTSSPFHVRFGKLNVLQSNEKVVEITVNGHPVNLQMKLGSNGEAFFVKECDEDDEYPLPDMLSTSPIQTDPGELMRQGLQLMKQQDLEMEESDYSDSDPDSIYQDEEYFGHYGAGDCLSDSELITNHHTQQQIDNNNRVVWNWGDLPHQANNTEPIQTNSTSTNYEEKQGFIRGMWEYIGRGGRKRKNTFSGTIVVQDGIYLDDIDADDPDAVSHYFGSSTKPTKRNSIYRGEEPKIPQYDEDFRRLDALSLERPRVYSVNTDRSASGSVSTQTRVTVKRNKRTQTANLINDLSEICLSTCGDQNIDNYGDHLVTYEQLQSDMSVLDNPDLIVKCGNDYYNWNRNPNEVLCALTFKECRLHLDSEDESSRRGSDIEDRRRGTTFSSQDMDETFERHVQYKKTVRLTSDDIEQLNLQPGSNQITFSVTTSLQGTTRCVCLLYLWDYTDKIIISDIDGTITRSDVFGHILPWVGKDWTQNNIAKLFTMIKNNGYKFLYLSSRAIGQASMTKRFLQTIQQNGIGIPEGPILLCPDSLLRTIKDEIVLRQPHIFKIQCLSDIRSMFGANSNPFYAGFGNRISDSKSYSSVGIPLQRIYIINHRGEIYTENSLVQQSTYGELYENNEVYFPVIKPGDWEGEEIKEEFLPHNYWKFNLPEIDDADLV